jgi:hypothetical protein
MSGALLNLGRTLLQGLRSGGTIVRAGASQARFTYGHLGKIGKGGSFLQRLKFSGTMGRRVMAEEFRALSPAAQQAIIRTGYAAGGTAVGAGVVQA